MYESVRSIRPGWIGLGWFIGVAISSLLVFVLTVLGLIRVDAPTEGMGVALSILVGFVIAGFVTGMRVVAAPVLHGLGMGLLSVVVWLGLNLLVGESADGVAGNTISAMGAASLLLLQTVSAVVGARAGVRFARRALSAV